MALYILLNADTRLSSFIFYSIIMGRRPDQCVKIKQKGGVKYWNLDLNVSLCDVCDSLISIIFLLF